MTLPAVKGWSWNAPTATPVVSPTNNPSGAAIAPGDWMVLVWGWSATTALRTGILAAPWRERIAPLGVGTMAWSVWTGVRKAGDTSYTIALAAGTQAPDWMLAWGSGPGPDENAWVLGAVGNRAGAPTQFEVTAPGISVPPESLVLALGMERTTASETLGQITADNGFTPYAMANPTNASALLAYKQSVGGGAVGAVKVVWPNSHAANGQLVQLGIPGVRSSVGAAVGVVPGKSGLLTTVAAPGKTPVLSVVG